MFLVLYVLSILSTPPNFNNRSATILGARDGFTFITNDSIYFTNNGVTFSARKHAFGLDVYRMVPVSKVELNTKTFLVSSGGGVVYRYDEVLDTLVRLDNSYLFMSRFGESKVSRKDTIFSYGGYGEFTYTNKLISFRQDFREWSVEPIEEPLPRPTNNNLIQYDSITGSVYVGFGHYSYFEDGVEKIKSVFDIYRFDSSHKVKRIGSLEDLIQKTNEFTKGLVQYKSFELYRLPMLYSNEGIWSFDLTQLKAVHHLNADKNRLQQYTDILAYNSETRRFLLASNFKTNDPRYHVANEQDLLGFEYEEYSLTDGKLPNWAYGLFALSLLLLIPLFRTKSFVVLSEAIQSHERRIQQRLSSEDFFILKRIVDAYPEYVEYPELQNSYEKDLSYESRIKKLRASIKEIDEVVQEVMGRKRNSIFEIEKGREDKRVKVIRIKNDQLKEVDLFGRLRRRSKQ
jgi:hypothetical protein